MEYTVFDTNPETKTPRIEHYQDGQWTADANCWLVNKMMETGFIEPEATQQWLLNFQKSPYN